MMKQLFKDIVTPELSEGAIINNEFIGFKEDYLVLWCLLKKYNPSSVFEIGTNFGTGTNIICNALPYADVYSLELPFGEGDAPLVNKGKDMTGVNCKLPFTQIRADSTTYDYSEYPCKCYYVDATHQYDNVFKETTLILEQEPDIIIFHDADIPEVLQAIQDAKGDYTLYRVTDTRIAYLLK